MLPTSVEEATDDHPLAQFSGNPVGCIGNDEDAWEKFNRPLDTSASRSGHENQKKTETEPNCNR